MPVYVTLFVTAAIKLTIIVTWRLVVVDVGGRGCGVMGDPGGLISPLIPHRWGWRLWPPQGLGLSIVASTCGGWWLGLGVVSGGGGRVQRWKVGLSSAVAVHCQCDRLVVMSVVGLRCRG